MVHHAVLTGDGPSWSDIQIECECGWMATDDSYAEQVASYGFHKKFAQKVTEIRSQR